MKKPKFPVRNDSFSTGNFIIPTGNMFFRWKLDCSRGKWIISCGNYIIAAEIGIIASGNFPITVEKMIFPVGAELFLTGNYLFLMSEDPSLMRNTCLLQETIHCRWKPENFHRGIY
jgi:hypothetical protein